MYNVSAGELPDVFLHLYLEEIAMFIIILLAREMHITFHVLGKKNCEKQ